MIRSPLPVGSPVPTIILIMPRQEFCQVGDKSTGFCRFELEVNLLFPVSQCSMCSEASLPISGHLDIVLYAGNQLYAV